LLSEGRLSDTPVAAIRWGSKAAQQTIVGTLGDIVLKTEAVHLEPPTVIVVGEVVQLRRQLNWYETKPLFGKRVVLTRAQEQAREFSQLLAAYGAEPVEVPTIQIVPPASWQAIDDAIRTAQAQKITAMSPIQFIVAQIVEGNPFIFPLWLIGLIGLLLSTRLQRYRVFGLTYLLLLILFIVQQAKPYYLAPAYPILLAAGATLVERAVAGRHAIHVAVAVGVIAGGLVVLPMSVPILPPETFVSYSKAIGLAPAQAERNALGALPQHMADRYGWENMARTIAHVYEALPPNERSAAAIVGSNYGEAGAVDYFGPALGLPKAISGHNNYWLWGYGNANGEVLITVGIRKDRLDELCSSVEQRATVVSPYAMPYETDLPIYVCRGLKIPIAEAWARLKRFV